MPKSVIYCRKSTEEDGRQVLSIESQRREMLHLAESRGVQVDEIITECKSAKSPGRPKFNQIMSDVQTGRVNRIVCWKLDRLARNGFDTGQLILAMSTNGLEILTPSQRFSKSDDNLIMLYIELGMAHKYIDDLSKNVKRGLKTRAENGWYPNTPPLGYKTETGKNGTKTIGRDLRWFQTVQTLWKLVVVEQLSVDKALARLNSHCRAATSPKRPSKLRKVSRSNAYRILNNTFYFGTFEFPRGSGRFYEGKHQPMVSEAEFEMVQQQLGPAGRPKLTRKVDFAYRGLITCGECQGTITFEEKYQLICSRCKHKFAYKNKSACPTCSLAITRMRNPKHLRYQYCRCSKKKNPTCNQRSVKLDTVEHQILQYLENISCDSGFVSWIKCRTDEVTKSEAEYREEERTRLNQNINKATMAIDNLLSLYTSPENATRSLLTQAEYSKKREQLMKEERRLRMIFDASPSLSGKRFKSLTEAAEFAIEITKAFRIGSSDAKTDIVKTTGSNLTLESGILSIRATKPFITLNLLRKKYLNEKQGSNLKNTAKQSL